MKIPFVNMSPMHSSIKDEMTEAFDRVYDSNYYILGQEVIAFEKEYAEFCGTKHCIGVGNGLDALHLTLLAWGIGVGDEVIVPSSTYIATALAVSFTGATPIFVEPDIRTANINPELIEKKISPNTKAIIAVQLYGQTARMTEINRIAQKHGLFVMEDGAQSHAACYKGKRSGNLADAGAHSFYPGKNLGALGDAGAITTNDDNLARKLRALRNYGSEKKYENKYIGFNSRLDELQSAFLRVKLKHLEEWTACRKSIGKYYDLHINNQSIVLPYTDNDCDNVFHIYPIRCAQRDRLREYLADSGIETMIHYPIPMHLQQAYGQLGHRRGSYPIAELIANAELSLPIWIGMTLDELEYVCNAINNF